MKINQLLLRTMKPDQTQDHNNIESIMERAGFIRKIDGRVVYTTLGLILINRIKKITTELLEEAGYSPIQISGQKDLLNHTKSVHEYHRRSASSFKDIPLRLYTIEEIELRKNWYDSLWKSRYQNIIGFSVLGEVKSIEAETMEKIMSKLAIPYNVDRNGYYYPTAGGQDHFSSETVSDRSISRELRDKKTDGDRMSVHTPGIRTIEHLCKFMKATPEEVIKTMLYTDGSRKYAVLIEGNKDVDLQMVVRILGIKEDSIRVMPPDMVKETTGADAGFAGPMDLKVDRILIDNGIRKDRDYIAGANTTDYHYKGLMYGRDFSGDFYSLHKKDEVSEGWLLGEVTNLREKVRVQSLKGDFDYHSLNIAYINIDRLFLAMAEHHRDDIGFNFPDSAVAFNVVVAVVDPRDEVALARGKEIYELISLEGISVLFDDRKDRMGSKFFDYDLIGIPWRVIIGKDGAFDVKDRHGVILTASMNNIVEIIRSKVIE